MTRAVSVHYQRDLARMARRQSPALQALKKYWPALEKQIKTEVHRLGRKIEKDDPIRLRVDLLTPLGCAADENLHTRALAYLFDESKPHGFTKSVLISFIDKVKNVARPGSGASQVLALLQRRRTEVSVTPEYRYRIEGFPNRSAARCDIWIELRSKKHAALVIIENKIAAPEGSGLRWYEREAAKWCKNHGGRALLVFLAPKGRETKRPQWVNLSYLNLASVLRNSWRNNRRAAARGWLELYIAAITGGLLEIDINRLQDIGLGDLQAYLE